MILASEGYFRFPECISLVEEHLKIPFFGLEKIFEYKLWCTMGAIFFVNFFSSQ